MAETVLFAFHRLMIVSVVDVETCCNLCLPSSPPPPPIAAPSSSSHYLRVSYAFNVCFVCLVMSCACEAVRSVNWLHLCQFVLSPSNANVFALPFAQINVAAMW